MESEARLLDDDMDTPSEARHEPAGGSPEYELVNLRREGQNQARQIAELQNMINQLTSQLMATPNEKKALKKPKIASPEKFDGDRAALRTFLTSVDLYCEFNEVAEEQDKILMASTYMKDKAANWIQPYIDDYIKDVKQSGTKDKTRAIFAS